MHESDPVQEVPDLLVGIVEGEALREIHVAPGAVRNAGRMVEVEQGLVAEGGPEGRLPARHLAEAAPTDRQLIGVEERKAGLELPCEGAPGVGGELDNGPRRGGAGLDGERRAVGHVGVAPSVGELDPERTDDRQRRSRRTRRPAAAGAQATPLRGTSRSQSVRIDLRSTAEM